MLITIFGAHGQIARQLTRMLVADGDEVRGVIRNPDHLDDVEADGATAIVCDLEHAPPSDVDKAVSGSDAVVFAAGAGPGSGSARKDSMDRDGAIAVVESVLRCGGVRFVMVGAMGTDRPPADDEVFSVYLRAKAAADEAVRNSGLDHVIIRPGGLTNDPPIGSVDLARHVDPGAIPRGDVAAVLAAVLHDPSLGNRTVEVVSGSTPIADAVAALATAPAAE